MVLLDAGDALSRLWPSAIEKADRPLAEAHAAFLLSQLGAMGYSALVVGERELVLGSQELLRRAAAAKLPLLAANLVDAQGKRPFPGRTMATAGGRKVGIFAVVDGGEYERHGLRCLSAAGAAQAEVDALRKAGAQVVVGLLHMNYDAALRVAGDLKGVDYVVQAHDGRPVLVQQVGATLMAGAGQRGQVVGRAVLDLRGAGPLFLVEDKADAQRAMLEQEGGLKRLQERMKAASDAEEKKQLGVALESARKRYDEARARALSGPPAGRRTATTDRLTLNASVPDDPKVKAAQDAAQQAAPERRR